MTDIDFLRAFRREAGAMRTLVADADFDSLVPTCPDWTVRDLVVHTGIVYRLWTELVRSGSTQSPTRRPEEPVGDVVAWFNESIDELLAVFDDADLDAPTWTWCPHEHRARWWVRRMAHETLIHGADAAIAAGTVPVVDETLAEDGIEEILVEKMTEYPAWATVSPGESTIELATPSRSWFLRTCTRSGTSSSSGEVYEDLPGVILVDPVDGPDARIAGSAADLDLWLWGRGPLSDTAVEGDRELAEAVRSAAAEAT